MVGIGDTLYLHAGTTRAAWVEKLEAVPSVRIRIDGMVYALSAARVESQAEFETFANAYEAKYGTRPRNEDVTEAYLYRVKSR